MIFNSQVVKKKILITKKAKEKGVIRDELNEMGPPGRGRWWGAPG